MNTKIKQAVILSAGLGTRLRPLTYEVPKVMIPILDKPLLEWQIKQFKKHDIREFFINLHHLPEVIKNYFGDGSKLNVKINYSFEPVILGTAGGVKKFENYLDEKFFLIYGDTFSLVNYSKMEESFDCKGEAIGMQRVGLLGYRTDVDLAELDSRGKFVAVYPKLDAPKKENLYSMRGIFVLKKKILKFVPPDVYYEIGKDLLPRVIKNEAFYGYECDDYSKGIDTIEKWKDVEEYLKKSNNF